MGLDGAAREVEGVFDAPLLTIGDHTVTLATVSIALAILAVSFLASWGFRQSMRSLQARRGQMGGNGLYVAGTIGRYVILVVGVLIATTALGLDLTSLSVFAGALGVGIGLGMQDMVRDFFAGIVLLMDRSIEVGDFVELEAGVTGEISAVGARATTIVTNDNVDVLVPNSMFLTGKLTNWTRNRATRRIHVPFSVAYGSDKEKVREAALEAARSVPFTLPEEGNQRTQVWLVSFGDSALNFELVVWPSLEAVKRPGRMMAAYLWAIDDALRKHGIEIPFPQRDLRVRSFFGHEEASGLAAWRDRDAPAAPPPAPQPSPSALNDAAQGIKDSPRG